MSPLSRSIVTFAVIVSSVVVSAANADETSPIEPFLMEGQLAEGARAMAQLIEAEPDNQQARFSLGMVQFFQAIEQFGQDQYRYGLLAGRARAMPFMRLPIPENPDPEQISYEKARAIIQRMIDQLQKAEQTLSAMQPGDVRLPLRLGQVRLDLNGDGNTPNEESVWYISQVLQNPRLHSTALEVRDFEIGFDAADVPWLRGYCHALSAVGEMILAYDWQDQFERTAHLFYPKVDSPYPYLAAEGPGQFMSFGTQNVLDIIAWVHTINYEVAEGERMQKALAHMETVIQLSRKSWILIQAENDDDREWVPSPSQSSVMRGFNVGQNVVSGWHEVLDEVELILQGRKLVPYWRGIEGGLSPFVRTFPANPEIGINVRRIFTHPTRFDLALWLQGTGLDPYLERGDITSPDKWQKMMGNFRGRFFNFMFWFN